MAWGWGSPRRVHRTISRSGVFPACGAAFGASCVVPPVIRTPLLSGTGSAGRCDGNLALDLNDFWASAPSSKLPAPGQQVDLQLWYRDPLSTSNQTTSLSDALEFCAAP